MSEQFRIHTQIEQIEIRRPGKSRVKQRRFPRATRAKEKETFMSGKFQSSGEHTAIIIQKMAVEMPDLIPG
jgi:hypothetical protein